MQQSKAFDPITGFMMLCVMQALGEMAVLYPVNGAYYIYMARFIDPAWYALNNYIYFFPSANDSSGASV